jgi:hypothetical protein
MIAPSMHVENDIFIHSARATVWNRFTNLQTWSLWNPQVEEITWAQGSPWSEGSVMIIRQRTLLGMPRLTYAQLRMAARGSAVVWESQFTGFSAVHSARFTDDLGGCRLSARHTYQGPVVPLLWILKPRQRRLLVESMARFKTFVEDP